LGVLFEQFSESPWIVIFLAIFLSSIVVIYAHVSFKKLFWKI